MRYNPCAVLKNITMIKKIALKQKNSLLIIATVCAVVLTARIEVLHGLAFIAIAPLVFLMQKHTLKKAIGLTALCATLFWIATSYWLVPANIDFAQANTLVVSVIFLLFCLWQALPYILAAAVYRYQQWHISAFGPLLAALALTVCWAFIPSPLPWLPINSLYTLPKFVAVLDLSGMSLLLFISTFYCFAIEYSLRKKAPYQKAYRLSLLIIPIVMLSYGQVRQMQLDNAKANSEASQWLEIGYIQPNLRFNDDFNRTYLITERLILENQPDLIVWPEISTPFSLDNNPKQRSDTLALVDKYEQDLLTVSGYIYTGNYMGDRQTYYNQAQLIENQEVSQRYSKEILVPFFEYLPKPLSFLRRFMPNVLIYEPGEGQQPLSYKGGINMAMAICYEVIFPGYVQKQVQQGGNILINPSSDAAFGGGVGGYYHLATAYFRAIENRVPWVRATNTGTSIIVDVDGKPLTAASKSDVVAIDSAKVFIPEEASLYGRLGDWFAWMGLLVLLIIVGGSRRQLLSKFYVKGLQ